MKRVFFLLYILLISLVLLVGCTKEKMSIEGLQAVNIGSTITLTAKTNSNEPIVWRSSNKSIATVNKGVVSGISVGEVVIYASCGKEQASIKVKVVGEKKNETVDPYLNKAKTLLSKMTLEQKVGELFVVSVSGGLSRSEEQLFSNCHIGNVILYPGDDFSKEDLASAVTDIQKTILDNNVVAGFVFNEKRPATYRLLSSLAIIPSSITVLATADKDNAYNVAYGFGNELRNFGYNGILSPNMLLNDEDESCYLDDPNVVSEYSNREIDGYKYSGVMPVAVSFPGGGSARWDDIPSNANSLQSLKQEDLLPFLTAFENDLDAVVVSNVIFSAFDSTYPATLSYPILTSLLREELEFKGIAISHYLDDSYLVRDYRDEEENIAVVAVMAGIDMLAYQTTTYVNEDYTSVLNAVRSNKIEEERIDEAVLRILSKKYKYDIVEDEHYRPAWNAKDYDPSAEIEIAAKIAKESIALLNGSIPEFTKETKLLIASPVAPSKIVDSDEEDENSFACILYSLLLEEEYSDISWRTFDSSDRNEMRSISQSSDDYDYVIFAINNIGYTRRLYFEDNCICISLSVPIDISRIEGVVCYISAYGYERGNVDAVIDCLINGAPIKDYREKTEE